MAFTSLSLLFFRLLTACRDVRNMWEKPAAVCLPDFILRNCSLKQLPCGESFETVRLFEAVSAGVCACLKEDWSVSFSSPSLEVLYVIIIATNPLFVNQLQKNNINYRIIQSIIYNLSCFCFRWGRSGHAALQPPTGPYPPYVGKFHYTCRVM